MELAEKVALVTGSAHRVGKAIALALGEQGANLVVHYDQSAEAAEQTTGELRGLGVEAMTQAADLRDPAAIETLFRAARARFGRLDVLVNSAANFISEEWDEVTADSWDAALNVNARAAFLCSQQAARLMRAGERTTPGLIVNIADNAGVFAWRNRIQHGVSKAALLHLTSISARELAPEVRVNALILGPIIPAQGSSAESRHWQELEASLPLQRSADPAEVGQAVIALAENDFITGAQIEVSGGEHLLGPGKF